MKHKITRKLFAVSPEMFHVPCSMFRDSRGQAVIAAVVFFLIIATAMGIGVTNPVLRQVKQSDESNRSRASLFASQSVNEDALYRLKTGKQFVSPSTLSLNGYSATASSTLVVGGLELSSSGAGFGLTRNLKTHLSSGSGTSFHYGMQSDKGGMQLNNSSTVTGNVYSNGPVRGAGNTITGDVVSAGPTGLADDIHTTGSVYAHTITDADVGGDAYYTSISDSTVGGASHSGSADQATTSLPITDAMVTTWEEAAVAGGVINSPCPYNTSGSVVLGPVKINCDLEVDGDTVTLRGPVWVAGNISITNSADVKIDPSLGNQSVAIIADKASDRSVGSTIELQNNGVFTGSGSVGSYILMLSQNNSAESGGSNRAIDVGNSAQGDLILYAGHGKIRISNNVNLKEVTGYAIELNNSANIVYQTGLVNLLFSSGPSGGYVFDRWREVE